MQTAIAETETPEPWQRPAAAPVQDDSTFGDIWLVLKHRRAAILATAAALVLATLAYCLLTPALYAATAQILIDPRDRPVVSNDVNAAAVAPDGGVTQVDSQARVIESSGVLLRAIRALNLAGDSEYASAGLFGFLAAGAETESAAGPGDATAAEMRTVRALKRKLAIKRADKVFVIDVTVTAQGAAKAARIANAITDAYLADQAEARTEAARRASGSLASRLDEQRRRVNEAENKVQRYKVDNNLIAAKGQLLGEQQLGELSNQQVAARSKTAELRARVDQIELLQRKGGRSDATAEAIDSTVVSQLRQRLAELVQREADLQSDLGPRHPALAAVQSQIRGVQQLVVAELGRIGRAARADYERARASEAALTRNLDTLKSGSVTNEQASVQLRELERDLEAARSVYASFLLRSQETRDQAGIDSPNARVITRAVPPEEKSWPTTGFLLLGALGGGLGLGAAAGLGAEHAAPRLLARSQARRALALPAVGVALPKGDGGAGPDGAAGNARLLAEPVLGRLLQPVASPEEASKGKFKAWSQPRVMRSLLLLSSSPADAGCGLQIAALLAAAAAAGGQRVLVVDAAPRADAAGAPGLQELMRGEQTLATLLAATGGGVLGPGVHQPDPADWSSRPKAAHLMRQAVRNFDMVVVNGGCLFGNPGLAPLVGATTQTILVARAGSTRVADAAETLETARLMGADVAAVLLAERGARARG